MIIHTPANVIRDYSLLFPRFVVPPRSANGAYADYLQGHPTSKPSLQDLITFFDFTFPETD